MCQSHIDEAASHRSGAHPKWYGNDHNLCHDCHPVHRGREESTRSQLRDMSDSQHDEKSTKQRDVDNGCTHGTGHVSQFEKRKKVLELPRNKVRDACAQGHWSVQERVEAASEDAQRLSNIDRTSQEWCMGIPSRLGAQSRTYALLVRASRSVIAHGMCASGISRCASRRGSNRFCGWCGSRLQLERRQSDLVVKTWTRAARNGVALH